MWDVKRTPSLARCTPESILYCAKFATEYGLPLGGTTGYVYVVPYRTKGGGHIATPILGYRGAIEVMMRGGKVKSIEARVVYENDRFELAYGAGGTKLNHVPNLDGDRGKIRLVYTIIQMSQSEQPYIEVMTLSEIEKVRNSSKARESGPWVSWFEEMAKKTVVKRAMKYIPMLPEVSQAIAKADESEFGDTTVIEADAIIEDVEETPTQTEKLKAALAAKAGSSPDNEDQRGPEGDGDEVPPPSVGTADGNSKPADSPHPSIPDSIAPEGTSVEPETIQEDPSDVAKIDVRKESSADKAKRVAMQDESRKWKLENGKLHAEIFRGMRDLYGHFSTTDSPLPLFEEFLQLCREQIGSPEGVAA